MRRMIAPVGSLVLALLIGAGGLVANAKHRAAAPPDILNGSIGSVDMEEVYNASGKPQELDQAARQHEAEGAQRINKIMAVPYLETTELEEYGAIIGKAQTTPEDDKRAAALRASNDQRALELTGLQTKPSDQLTAADKARLSHLSDLRQTLQSQVRPGLISDFQRQHEGWMADYRHHQIVELRKEVGKVAKEKHIAHVFDSSTLVYSDNDLTPVVLQRVAKKAARN